MVEPKKLEEMVEDPNCSLSQGCLKAKAHASFCLKIGNNMSDSLHVNEANVLKWGNDFPDKPCTNTQHHVKSSA